MIDVHVWYVLAGGLSAVVIGMIWYSPRVFGGSWMGLVNLSPEKVEIAKKRMPSMAVLGFLAAIVLSWTMAHLILALGMTSIVQAIKFGFLVWAGCMIPPLLAPVLWEQKEIKYFAITAGYWLLTTLSIAIIVSLSA